MLLRVIDFIVYSYAFAKAGLILDGFELLFRKLLELIFWSPEASPWSWPRFLPPFRLEPRGYC